MRVITAVGGPEFPIAERALQAVDREWRCRNDQRRHETRRNGELLLRDKVVRKPSGDSHHGKGDEEEADAAERLPSECDERRDAADRNHPAEVIEQMVERELRAPGLFGLEEGPERARLRLANDAALGGSLELGPFDVHGRNRVSTTKPYYHTNGLQQQPLAERHFGCQAVGIVGSSVCRAHRAPKIVADSRQSFATLISAAFFPLSLGVGLIRSVRWGKDNRED